jgi:hypothetical protein
VYLVILLAAGAILGGVVVVAMGRGGEMALFDRDLALKITRLETPGDVATLELPFGLVGYQARATGQALTDIANLLARRDAEITALRQEIWRLGLAPPEAGRPEPAGPDIDGLDVGASSYAASSSAAWADSAAQAFAGQAYAAKPFAAEEAPVDSDLGPGDVGQEDEASGPEQAGQLDEASQVDRDSRP